MVEPRGIRIVRAVIAGRTEDETKVAIEVLHVRLAIEDELVLAERQGISEDEIVEELRTSAIRDRDVDVVDSDDFRHALRNWAAGGSDAWASPQRIPEYSLETAPTNAFIALADLK